MLRYSSLVMSTTTVHLWNDTEDGLWINLYTNKLQWFRLWLVKLLIIGLLQSFSHIFISLIHHFPRNIHMLNRLMVLILMPFIPDTTINWNLWHPPFFSWQLPKYLNFWRLLCWNSCPRANIVFKCPHQFFKKIKSANMTFCTLPKL